MNEIEKNSKGKLKRIWCHWVKLRINSVLIKRVYTPSPVAIAYTTMNGMENLRFDKEGYFHISVSYGLFYKKKGKENISLVFPYAIETLVKVWEKPQNSVETLALRSSVPTSISRSPKLPFVFLELYGNMENWCFLFLKRNTIVTRKVRFTVIQYVFQSS